MLSSTVDYKIRLLYNIRMNKYVFSFIETQIDTLFSLYLRVARELSEDGRLGDWSSSFTGKRIYIFDPRQDDIVLEDIFHSMCFINRWGGHATKGISVAEHTLLMFRNAGPLLDGEGYIGDYRKKMLRSILMHDAPECYLGDVKTPIKNSPLFQVYRRLEAMWWHALSIKFALCGSQEHPVIKKLDRMSLFTERRDCVPGAVKAGFNWNDREAPPFADSMVPTKSPEDLKAELFAAWETCKP